MVGNPQDVQRIILESVLSTLNPGVVIVDRSSPSLVYEIYAAACKKGWWFIDAPVSGSDIGARQGKLAIFARGERSVVKWLKPLFDLMGRVTYMGGAGCGQSCKIGNQILVGAYLMGLSEVFVFAEKAGLDLRKYKGAIRGGGLDEQDQWRWS
ncbi:hypothetical protein V6N13_115085 [Hibiscus sabdariffa]|uniref:6-phosphogluconate dehydrogenase NADP-binding domain-containing protein n=1 Tax=Hibiscus sabdariffa TaxID=183260 RepID=A0ABR2U435_9ROSI